MGNLRPRLRDPQRGEAAADQYHERVDEDTGELWLCKGNALLESEDTIQRIQQLTFRNRIVGQDGHIMAVDVAGRASVSVDNAPGARPRVNSSPWQILIDGSTATTTFATLASGLSLNACVATSVDATLGGAEALINPDGYEAAFLIFGGTDTANDNYEYRLSRVYKMEISSGSVAWIPATAGQGVVTLATPTYTPAAVALGATGNLFADDITITTPPAGIMLVSSAVADMNMPFLVVDMMGADALIIEVDVGTGTPAVTMDVFGKLGDYPRSMADITLLKVYSHATGDLDVTQA